MWELNTPRPYRSGLRKLYQVHWARPHWTTTQALDAQITTELQNGSSPSVVRTILSVAAWAGTLGYLDEPIPAGMGKLPKAAAKRQTRAPPEWGSFAALTEMAETASTARQWTGVLSQQRYCQRLWAYEYRRQRPSNYGTSMGWQEESPAGTRTSTTNGTPGPSVIMEPPGPWCYTTQRRKSWDAHQTNSFSLGPDNWNALWQNSYGIPHTKRCDGMDGDGHVQRPSRQQGHQHKRSKDGADGEVRQPQQYMDCQHAERISKNPWAPLPPNPTKKVLVSKTARRELRELWLRLQSSTAAKTHRHPAPKNPPVDRRIQRQSPIPPREAGSRGPRPGESERGRGHGQGQKGGGASSAYPQGGRRRGETTAPGPLPVPPTTGMADLMESGPEPACTEVGGVQSNPKTVAHVKGQMSLVPHRNCGDGLDFGGSCETGHCRLGEF